MGHYYILKGKKIIPVSDVLKWARWFEGKSRLLWQETLPNGYFISTVFIGIGGVMPQLFETMVFKDGDSLDEIRTNTYDDAQQAHEEMVYKWSKQQSSESTTGEKHEEIR